MAQIKRSVRPEYLSVSAEVHTAKASYFHNKINSASDTCNLFKTFSSLLLSTLSSLGITGIPLRWLNPISMVGLSRCPGEGRYPKHINWSLGFLKDQFLDPSSSPHTLHHWVPSYKHMVSPTIDMLMTHSSISHFDLMIQR